MFLLLLSELSRDADVPQIILNKKVATVFLKFIHIALM